ncbi:MAG: methylamine dehydrogenase (amicyanin) light chain, partial [Acetobacter fabarum]|nr:methylamine dehydrogenase (amicyanin) light chain [Acetobacter fabarum]
MLPSEHTQKTEQDVSLFDRMTESVLRRFAGRTSRRGVVARLGGLAAAVPLFPLLPVSRASAATPAAGKAASKAPTPFGTKAQVKDANACDYWRYCAIDGNLCTSCGGGVHSC